MIIFILFIYIVKYVKFIIFELDVLWKVEDIRFRFFSYGLEVGSFKKRDFFWIEIFFGVLFGFFERIIFLNFMEFVILLSWFVLKL